MNKASNSGSRLGRSGSHWSTTSRAASRKSRGKSTEADEEDGVDEMGVPLNEKKVGRKGRSIPESIRDADSGEEEEGMIPRR